MGTGKKVAFFWLICLFLFLQGCERKAPPKPPERPVFERLSVGEIPGIRDDGQEQTLRAAVAASTAWYGRVPEDRSFPFGTGKVTAKVLKESLDRFVELLDAGTLDAQTLAREFDVFRVVPPDRDGRMLVTGYYEPVLEGSLKQGGRFKWPLYGIPPDLVTIDLERFDPVRFHGERLSGRVEKNRVVPYYTRSEIDGKGKLNKSGVQIVWLADPVGCFFLHIQGSGMITLPDGGILRVGYAGSNGRPYSAIGKTLLDQGVMTREEMSLQAIRKYLQAHPESREQIMWGNESYVFFRVVPEGPRGSLETVLTAGRSVASDPKFHPRGAFAFLITERPRYDDTGQVVGWEPVNRWVFNQDTGGAIKGAGRIDLFCGTGTDAERIAGPMKQPGTMLYFIKKGLFPEG